MEDKTIVTLYLARNERAIRETASKYGRRLRSLSYGIVEERETAEECENDTYLSAWDSIPPHEPWDYLYAFLARIIRHLSLDRCRANHRLKRSAPILSLGEELEECLPSPDDSACRLDDLALSEVLDGFLAGLSAEKRVLFLRRYWYCDSIETLARRTGRSEAAVKTALFRLREALREHLAKEGITV